MGLEKRKPVHVLRTEFAIWLQIESNTCDTKRKEPIHDEK